MRFIKKSWEYEAVYSDSQKKTGSCFVFLINKNTESTDQLQVGIVVSRKVGKAVVRNKVKRRIKSFLRNSDLIFSGYKMVIIARKAAEKATWTEIKNDLTAFFEKERQRMLHPGEKKTNKLATDVNCQ